MTKLVSILTVLFVLFTGVLTIAAEESFNKDERAHTLGYHYKIEVVYYDPNSQDAYGTAEMRKSVYYVYIFGIDEVFTTIGQPWPWQWKGGIDSQSLFVNSTRLNLGVRGCIAASEINETDWSGVNVGSGCIVVIDGMNGTVVITLLYDDFENKVNPRVVFRYPHPLEPGYLKY